MHQHRTEIPLSYEVDPAYDGLTPAKVVAIHKAHLTGTPWATLARQYGVDKRYIARIVRGTRWPQLHPSQRPDLYSEKPEAEPTYTTEQITAAARVGYQAFVDELRRARRSS